jgi:hypothetical protein
MIIPGLTLLQTYFVVGFGLGVVFAVMLFLLIKVVSE